MCSQISCGPTCLHMQQLRLCKWPFIWTVAACVYITPRTNIFRITFSNKFQNSTLVNSSIPYTTSILEACKLSLLCRTFQIVISGMPRCKLLQATTILLTKLTWQPHAFTFFSDVHGRRGGLRFSTSTFSLNWLIEPRITWPTGRQSRCKAAMDLVSASRVTHSASVAPTRHRTDWKCDRHAHYRLKAYCACLWSISKEMRAHVWKKTLRTEELVTGNLSLPVKVITFRN
jgi:hypothetical protein